MEREYFDLIDYVRIIKGVKIDLLKREVKIEISDAGDECEFLRFLENTSNDYPRDRHLAKLRELVVNQFILCKLICLGYLTSRREYQMQRKIVIACNILDCGGRFCVPGHTGKSLFAEAIGHACRQVIFEGDIRGNIADCIDEDITNITIKGLDKKFSFKDYEDSIIQARLNAQNNEQESVSLTSIPKLYVTTNSYNFEDARDPDFCWLFFSHWYNEDWTPQKEFGHRLFHDWDFRQWQLFHSLVEDCQELYRTALSSGLWESSSGIPSTTQMWDLPF